MMMTMMTGTSLYESYVVILHCNFYERAAVKFEAAVSFVYFFLNKYCIFLRYKVYTLLNVNTFPASPECLWDACSVLLKLGPDICY